MRPRPLVARLLCLPILLLGAATAEAQQIQIPHRTFELPNGLQLIVHEDRSVPMAAVNVWYHVGSGSEDAGRTGFAHLFEHLMFEGSANVEEGDFDNLLEGAGAVNNGSTNSDRTNYYEILPSNAVELALWLEADRMGGLLESMSQEKLDGQRDVVKNERRQSYENRPYGVFWASVDSLLYPAGHPYSWSTIGSMDDLSAASVEDVEGFFRRFYVPNNASLVVAGDVDADEVHRAVQRLFGWIPRGEEVRRPEAGSPPLPSTRAVTLEDEVSLPRLYVIWRGDRAFGKDDAALDALARILAGGKNSRLYRRLVYDQQVAQNVGGFHYSQLLSGDFFLDVTAKDGVDLDRIHGAVREEVARIAAAPPTAEELQRVKSSVETELVSSLETVGGKAERLNRYYYYTGRPDYAQAELDSFRALTPADVQLAARDYLATANSLIMSIVPAGKTGLAAEQEVAR